MGLKIILVSFIFILMMGCAAHKTVQVKENHTNQKRYIACCDPGLNANDKDVCKWMYENRTDQLRDWSENVYEGVWSDCKRGEETWRKWE